MYFEFIDLYIWCIWYLYIWTIEMFASWKPTQSLKWVNNQKAHSWLCSLTDKKKRKWQQQPVNLCCSFPSPPSPSALLPLLHRLSLPLRSPLLPFENTATKHSSPSLISSHCCVTHYAQQWPLQNVNPKLPHRFSSPNFLPCDATPIPPKSASPTSTSKGHIRELVCVCRVDKRTHFLGPHDWHASNTPPASSTRAVLFFSSHFFFPSFLPKFPSCFFNHGNRLWGGGETRKARNNKPLSLS